MELRFPQHAPHADRRLSVSRFGTGDQAGGIRPMRESFDELSTSGLPEAFAATRNIRLRLLSSSCLPV